MNMPTDWSPRPSRSVPDLRWPCATWQSCQNFPKIWKPNSNGCEQRRWKGERRALRELIESPDPDFKQLAGRLKNTQVEGTLKALVRLAQVECSMEANPQGVPAEQVAFAEHLIFDQELKFDPLDYSYRSYVTALLLKCKPGTEQLGESAESVMKALGADRRPTFLGPKRLAHCSEILRAAVLQRIAQREGDAADRPPEKWLDNPFGDAEAADVEFRWLQQADALSPLPPELQVEKALAAAHKTEPDWKAARAALADSPLPPDTLPAIPLWLLRARLQPAGAKETWPRLVPIGTC